jgi:hypothetical protein
VRHFLLHRGRCTNCGKEAKARVPSGHGTGYGPRLSGLIESQRDRHIFGIMSPF